MNETKGIVTGELADFFEDSFRSLKANKLGSSILTLCRDMAREELRLLDEREKAAFERRAVAEVGK